MDLSDITILIPSIGRDSLKRAFESVPKECKVKVLIQGKFSEEDTDKFKDFIPEPNLSFSITKFGPGVAKSHLVKSVKTKFFMILDDDDWIPTGYLEECLKFLNEGYKWVCPSILGQKESEEIEYRFICSLKDVNDRLFNYTSFDESYARYHLYPCNSTIMSTSEFLKCGEFHHLDYADDLIPVLNFMMNYRGVMLMNRGLLGDEGNNSVSRRLINKDRLQRIVKEITIKIYESNTDLEIDIWKRALNNTFDRVCHINSIYKCKTNILKH